jgi:hypothetical protein
MCKKCEFWIKQNDALIKTNAALGERNRALEKICSELSYGELAGILEKLSSDQLQAVKVFAGLLLTEAEKTANLSANRQRE